MKVVKVNIDGEDCNSIQEVYCNTVLETEEGNRLVVCMRDDTVEMKVRGFDKWFRANMETGEIESL